MKLFGRAAEGFCRRPDLSRTGALLFGPDPALVAQMRQALVVAVAEGEDLRTTRLDAGELRRTPALLHDALRERGFFPGRRAVVVEGARDGLADAVAAAVDGLTTGDAFLVLEADALTPRSALRKLFEPAGGLVSLGLYPDPPDAADLGAMLREAGASCGLSPDAEAAFMAFAAEADRGSLVRTVETVALYALGQETPLGAGELAPLLPGGGDVEIDQLFAAVAAGDVPGLRNRLARLSAAGTTPATVAIRAGGHFRQLLAIAAGEGKGFGRRQQDMAPQAAAWGAARLETAVRLIHETDRTIRSAGTRPDRAILERCLIRLARLAPRR